MKSGIYEIISPSGKRYIGSSCRLTTRKSRHFKDLQRGIHCNRFLQNAWNRYGTLEFKVLIVCRKQDLLFYEQACLDGFRPEYNLSPTASSTIGVKHTEDFRAKVSANTKGIVRSPETRAKMSASFTGLKKPPRTPEHQAKIIAANIGKQRSPETKAKISAALKGRVFTPEWRQRISDAKKKGNKIPRYELL